MCQQDTNAENSWKGNFYTFNNDDILEKNYKKIVFKLNFTADSRIFDTKQKVAKKFMILLIQGIQDMRCQYPKILVLTF